MESTYQWFEIEIEATDTNTYVVYGRYRGHNEKASISAKPALFNDFELKEARGWLERGQIDSEFAIIFGQRLFHFLFPEPIQTLYRQAINEVGPNGILRITLDFPIPSELKDLPWELIYDPHGGIGFLARSTNSPFVRHYTNLPRKSNPAPEIGPLQALIITASPPGMPNISSIDEIEKIRQNLLKRRLNIVDIMKIAANHALKTHNLHGLGKRIRQRQLVEVDVLEHATREKIQETLLHKRYHIIHFIGHGKADGEPGLFLEAEPGKPPEISATDFAVLVGKTTVDTNQSTVNLVVLNACETASDGSIQSISKAVLDQGVPAVVGMQIKVLDEAAVDFGREFYGAWAAGQPIESALAYARRLMTSISRGSASDWSIPVLYMGPEEGLKLDITIPPIPRIPLLFRAPMYILTTVVGIIGILSALVFTLPDLNKYFRTQAPVIKCIFPWPMAEDPSFNIAIAPFTIANQNNSTANSHDGFILANDLFKRIKANVQELDLPLSYDIREPMITCPIEGKTSELRQQAAKNMAAQIRADILIYGVIQEDGKMSPEFYVNYKGFEQGAEVTGAYQLGRNIFLTLPLDEVEIQQGINTQLINREKALIQIVLGLSYITVDNFSEAMKQFRKTDSLLIVGNDDQAKSVLYVLMGGTSQSMAALIRDISPDEYKSRLIDARNYYLLAHNLDPLNARAQLGLANISYLDALGDLFGEKLSVDPEKLAKAEREFQVALNMPNSPESANIPSKVHYGFGQIYLAQEKLANAKSEFFQVIEHYQGGDESIEGLASHAYALLGWIARQENDYSQAVVLINSAISHSSPYYRVRYRVLLGDTYRAEGNKEKACTEFATAAGMAENRKDMRTIQELQSIMNDFCNK